MAVEVDPGTWRHGAIRDSQSGVVEEALRRRMTALGVSRYQCARRGAFVELLFEYEGNHYVVATSGFGGSNKNGAKQAAMALEIKAQEVQAELRNAQWEIEAKSEAEDLIELERWEAKERSGGAVSRASATWEMPVRSKFEALGEIAANTRRMDELQASTDALVQEARQLGASWGDIGEAAGIRSQSAQQRWDPAAKAKHAERQRSRYGRTPT